MICHVKRLPVIDVIKHDEVIESRAVSTRRRSLTNLCQYYGVAPGGHNALSDARASVEVFLAQVARNDARASSSSPHRSRSPWNLRATELPRWFLKNAPSGRVDALRGRWRSLVAHFLDMEGVTGSSPVRPTIFVFRIGN